MIIHVHIHINICKCTIYTYLCSMYMLQYISNSCLFVNYRLQYVHQRHFLFPINLNSPKITMWMRTINVFWILGVNEQFYSEPTYFRVRRVKRKLHRPPFGSNIAPAIPLLRPCKFILNQSNWRYRQLATRIMMLNVISSCQFYLNS